MIALVQGGGQTVPLSVQRLPSFFFLEDIRDSQRDEKKVQTAFSMEHISRVPDCQNFSRISRVAGIGTAYFWELSDKFLGKSTLILRDWLKFCPPPILLLLLDPGSEILDP